jgi:tetratricopeptide (TPR) repeat protein
MKNFPTVTHQSPLALRVLIGLRRYDEAETMMRAGQKKSPNESFFPRGLAEIAEAKHDIDATIERWAFVRKRFPGVVEGYSHGADALLQKDRIQEAEDLVLQAIKKFPDSIGGPLEYARIAVKQKKWEDAVRRWEPIREQFALFAGGYVGGAQALTQLGRYEEAEELLQQARVRFGTDPGPLTEFARIAEVKGDVPQAVQRWKDLLIRFPLEWSVQSNASEAFERLGDPAEAEATLRAAIDRFPGELGPLLSLAKSLHHKRRDFPAAAEAWRALRAVFPDFEEAYTSGAAALTQAGKPEEAEALREEYRTRAVSA